MRPSIHKLLRPPVFSEDEDKTNSAAIMYVLGWCTLFLVATFLVLRVIQGQDTNLLEVNLILTTVLIGMGLVLYFVRNGRVRGASILFIATIWIALSVVTWVADGIRDVAFLGYTVPILLAGLFLGWRGALTVTIASIASGWMLAYAEASGSFHPTLDTPMNFARDMTGVFALIGLLIYFTISSLQRAILSTRMTARELSFANQKIENLRLELEQRVEERTLEVQRQTGQLEAVSSVARTIASVQDLDSLLSAIAELVSQRFGFYHVGIFLFDEDQQRAFLRASSSSAGILLVNQNFSLVPDEHSIVGFSLLKGEPRVAPDVTADAAFLDNPNLPETRSEAAVPLRVAGRVIGALDVQSRIVNAFSQQDLDVLSTLADQVAIAIENSRLFSEARAALDQSEALFEKYVQQDWRRFARQVRQTGYVFDGKQVFPLDPYLKRPSATTAVHTGRLTLEKQSASIAIPIKLRGQTIGVLDVRSKKGSRTWRQDEIAMLEAAAERAALALENARLVESAQRRAARERAIGDISTQVGSLSSLESILQTAVEQLGRKIGGATEVTLEIARQPEPRNPQ